LAWLIQELEKGSLKVAMGNNGSRGNGDVDVEEVDPINCGPTMQGSRGMEGE